MKKLFTTTLLIIGLLLIASPVIISNSVNILLGFQLIHRMGWIIYPVLVILFVFAIYERKTEGSL